MFLLTVVLTREYLHCKHLQECLVVLRGQYSDHVAILRKTIAKHSPKQRTCALVSPMSFLVVNRQEDYLKQAALAYAKKNNIEKAFLELYQVNEWTVANDMPEKNNSIRQIATKTSVAKKNIVSLSKKQPANNSLENVMPHVRAQAPFQWPIERNKLWISSPFGPRKKKNGSWGFHHGLDMAALKGTPVQAVANGVVEESYSDAVGYGNTIVIRHNNKFKTRYAHLDERMVRPGQKVARGMVIGRVGNTGNVRSDGRGDGTHLHFEVYVFGKRVNPIYFLP